MRYLKLFENYTTDLIKKSDPYVNYFAEMSDMSNNTIKYITEIMGNPYNGLHIKRYKDKRYLSYHQEKSNTSLDIEIFQLDDSYFLFQLTRYYAHGNREFSRIVDDYDGLKEIMNTKTTNFITNRLTYIADDITPYELVNGKYL